MKNRNSGMLAAVFAVFFAAMAINPVAATPIPVGVTPGADLIINFDFLSPAQSPPPPYANVNPTLILSGWDASETITADVFGGFNGTGGLLASVVLSGPSPMLSFGIFDPLATDGQYSLGIRLGSGAVDLASATSSGRIVTGAGVIIPGTIGQISVPEPSTVALLILALAGMAWARRKHLM